MKTTTKSAQNSAAFKSLLAKRHKLIQCYMNSDNTHLNIAVKTETQMHAVRRDLTLAGMILAGTYTEPNPFGDHWSASFARR